MNLVRKSVSHPQSPDVVVEDSIKNWIDRNLTADDLMRCVIAIERHKFPKFRGYRDFIKAVTEFLKKKIYAGNQNPYIVRL